MRAIHLTIPATLVALLLTACGSGSSLTTGSLFGSGSNAGAGEIPAPKPITASDRAVHTGATIARAQRCGFFFDPDQLRANYIATETQAGTPPDMVQRSAQELDRTRQALTTVIAKDDSYCTEGRAREVKAALAKQLAGDFTPPQARQAVNVGWWEHQKKEAAFDGGRVFERATRTGPQGGQ